MYIYRSTIRILKLLQRPRKPETRTRLDHAVLWFAVRFQNLAGEKLGKYAFLCLFRFVWDGPRRIGVDYFHVEWTRTPVIAIIPRRPPFVRVYEIRRHRIITDDLVRIRSSGQHRTALTSVFCRYRNRVNVGRDDPTRAKRLRGEITGEG